MIPLFIPYVNRPDLLEKAVVSARCSSASTFVLNNSGKEIDVPAAWICAPDVPLSFAQTQNWMLKSAVAKKVPFYLFMHSDAEAEEGTVDNLVKMASLQTQKWGAIFTAYDALAAFNTEAMTAIGGWDTMLSWYLADCDCYRRLRIAGYQTLESNFPVKHTPSQTLNSDPSIRRAVELEVPFRQAYYRAKWGGDNEHETFTVPWGGQ